MSDTNRNKVALTSLGVLHYFLIMFCLDKVQSLSWPLWLSEFASSYGTYTAHFLWESLTSAPTILVVSSVVAVGLSRIIDSHFFQSGLVVLAVTLVIAVLVNPIDGSHLDALRSILIPSHWSQLPVFVTLIGTLPVVSWLCGRPAKAA